MIRFPNPTPIIKHFQVSNFDPILISPHQNNTNQKSKQPQQSYLGFQNHPREINEKKREIFGPQISVPQ